MRSWPLAATLSQPSSSHYNVRLTRLVVGFCMPSTVSLSNASNLLACFALHSKFGMIGMSLTTVGFQLKTANFAVAVSDIQ